MANWKLYVSGYLLAIYSSGPLLAETITIEGKAQKVSVPSQTRLELLATGMDSPRLLSFSASGDLVVGSQSGNVYRLKAPYTKAEVLIRFGGYPHSVAFRKTAAGEELWLASTDSLYKTIYDPKKEYKKADFQLVTAIPGGSGHTSRTVKVGPDQRVYVSLGISGNCSDEYIGPSSNYVANKRKGGIFVLDEGSKTLKAFASGLRNPVGFAWEPQTGKAYASNNGPDHLGFDQPLEIFTPVSEGSFHGMPWYQIVDGQVVRDKCISSEPPRSDLTKPVAFFPSRSAPLDLAFAPGGPWKGQAFVALHGSWATPPSGGPVGDISGRREPKIVQVVFSNGKATGEVKDFISGFQLRDGSRWGRPAGLAFGPDGALYFTSDSDTLGLFRLAPPKTQ